MANKVKIENESYIYGKYIVENWCIIVYIEFPQQQQQHEIILRKLKETCFKQVLGEK